MPGGYSILVAEGFDSVWNIKGCAANVHGRAISPTHATPTALLTVGSRLGAVLWPYVGCQRHIWGVSWDYWVHAMPQIVFIWRDRLRLLQSHVYVVDHARHIGPRRLSDATVCNYYPRVNADLAPEHAVVRSVAPIDGSDAELVAVVIK